MRALLLLLSITSLAHAQTRDVFTLRPSLGVNGCQIHGDAFSGYDKLGLFGGVAVNGRTGNARISYELGFYFSQKGSRHVPNKYNSTYYRLNLNCIDMPLLWRCQVNDKWFVTLGPSASYLVSYRENRDYIDYTGTYRYNRFTAGVNAGLGRAIGRRLSLELRMTNSVTPERTFAANTWYPNFIARWFQKGYYSNLLSLFVTVLPASAVPPQTSSDD